MCILKEYYYEPLVSTGIFTSDELVTLFSDITHLIEIHSRLRDELIDLRDQYGYTDAVGSTLLNWVSYCRILILNTEKQLLNLYRFIIFIDSNINKTILGKMQNTNMGKTLTG